ncbi:hypothetical protein EMPS_09749 [Entomortierella parvispora]|uniref:Distal membrane-arm assembly complex protein 1-like domain-containing protein n=1 Tax=Entomortierella parvispora TaxID=205924 RepID=A0A9P3HIV6_9FUNG|nr:hypothetical protein EMPS_09749 [Entomortierella parvispora]
MSKAVLPMATEVKTDTPQAAPVSSTEKVNLQQQYNQQHRQQPQQQQLPGDCLPCKLIGCAGFGGLGLYSFYQAQQLPKNLVARRLGLGVMGSAFIAAAVYRLTMPISSQEAPQPEK